MKHRIVVVAALLSFGLGLGAGWFVFSKGAEHNSEDMASVEARDSTTRQLSALGSGSGGMEGLQARAAGGDNPGATVGELGGIVDKISRVSVLSDGEVVRELEPIVAGLDGAGFATLMKELDGKFTGRRRQRTLWALAEKFAGAYPSEAIVFASDPTNFENRGSTIIFAAVAKLGEESPRDALELIRNLKAGDARSMAVDKLFDVAALDHPELFIRWCGDKELHRELFGTRQTDAIADAVRFVAGEDPQRAIALLDAMDFGSERMSVIGSVAGNWSQLDPRGAFEWASGLATEEERAEARKRIFGDAARVNPRGLIELLEHVPDEERRDHLNNIAEGWGNVDAHAAMAWAESLQDEGEREQSMDQILSEARGRDPSSIVDLLEIIGELPERSHEEFRGMVGRWARDDPDAAMEWAGQLGDEEEREIATGAVMNRLIPSDPARVAEFLSEGPDIRRTSHMVKALMEGWVGQDLEAASDWARGLPDEARVFATEELISEISSIDPRRAAAELAALLESQDFSDGEGDELSQMGHAVAVSYGGIEPHETAEILLDLPAGIARQGAIGQLAGAWLLRDAVGVSEWASQLPPGGERDMVAGRIVNAISATDTVGALAWAASLQETANRIEYLQHVIRDRPNDRDSVREAVESADMNETERAMLLRELEQ